MPWRLSAFVFEAVESRVHLASISGHLFNDLNNNGLNDAEPALSGWTVYLDQDRDHALDGGEQSTVSDGAGDYTLSGVPAGNYLVGIVAPTGWQVTYPGNAGFAPAFSQLPGKANAINDNAVKSALARVTDLSLYSAPQIRGSHSWVIGLPKGATIDALASSVDAISIEPLKALSDTYILNFSERRSGSAIATRLKGASGVSFFYPVVKKQQSSRFIPNDASFGSQWHLRNTGQTGGTSGADSNIATAWDTYKGSGVVIGIVDDGLERTHEDLLPNYDPALSYDYWSGDSDPMPTSIDRHGTAVAGIAAARGNNSVGVSGTAPLATLAGIRLTSGDTGDDDESAALSHLYESIDIYNSSWGPRDDGLRLEAPGPLTLATFADGTSNGRGGLGSIFVWAAGNGLTGNDDVNYDGYANSRFVIAVSAIDHNGIQSSYSEPGAPILVAAYSSGTSVGTTTTDLTGSNGYSLGSYTSSFGGTSSSSPLVAGITALMLEANPNLTWRDVQHVLVHSAEKNHAADSGWTNNGAGLHVSHKYGFGAVDATAAVQLAQNWTNVGPEQSITSGVLNVNQAIPDNSTTGVTQTFTVNSDLRLETVELVLNATHTSRGHLKIVLTSPSGTESVLANVHNDSGDNYSNWLFTTKRNWDENARGVWTVKITDGTAGTSGTFTNWKLNLYGTSMTDSGTHYVVVNSADAVAGRNFGAHDIAAPTVASSIFNFEQSQTVDVSFSEDVAATLDLTDLVLENVTTTTIVPSASINLNYNALTNTATLSFPGFASGILPDGNYKLTLAATSVSDASGNALAVANETTFFVLGGDINRDRTVDINDLATLATNWQTSAQDFSHGDMNYDELVDINDLAILATNWQANLPAPAAPLVMSATLTSDKVFAAQSGAQAERRRATSSRAVDLLT